MAGHRVERIQRHILQEVSLLFEREVSDPRLARLTVTRVEVSGDLRVAKVFVAPAEDDAAVTRETMRALAHAAGYFRHHIAESLDLKFAPEIRFQLDRALAQGERFLRALDEVRGEVRAAPERGMEDE